MKRLRCKQTKLVKRTSTKYILVLVFFCFFLVLQTTNIHAYNLEPAIKEFLIQPNQTTTSYFEITNTADEKKEIEIYTERYDPKEEEILKEKNFVETKTRKLLLEPEGTETIEYEIQIPDDMLAGSYFAVIVVENVNQRGEDDGIGINYGVGSLIAVHIVDDTDISEVFLNQTEARIEYEIPLNPLNTKFKYYIKNNSNFVFLPIGQIAIVHKDKKPTSFAINSDEERLYPEQELVFEFEYQGNYYNLLEDKIVNARVGMQHSDTLKETETTLLYFEQTKLAIILLISTLAIITTIVVGIKRISKSS